MSTRLQFQEIDVHSMLSCFNFMKHYRHGYLITPCCALGSRLGMKQEYPHSLPWCFELCYPNYGPISPRWRLMEMERRRVSVHLAPTKIGFSQWGTRVYPYIYKVHPPREDESQPSSTQTSPIKQSFSLAIHVDFVISFSLSSFSTNT